MQLLVFEAFEKLATTLSKYFDLYDWLKVSYRNSKTVQGCTLANLNLISTLNNK